MGSCLSTFFRRQSSIKCTNRSRQKKRKKEKKKKRNTSTNRVGFFFKSRRFVTPYGHVGGWVGGCHQMSTFDHGSQKKKFTIPLGGVVVFQKSHPHHSSAARPQLSRPRVATVSDSAPACSRTRAPAPCDVLGASHAPSPPRGPVSPSRSSVCAPQQRTPRRQRWAADDRRLPSALGGGCRRGRGRIVTRARGLLAAPDARASARPPAGPGPGGTRLRTCPARRIRYACSACPLRGWARIAELASQRRSAMALR